MDFLKLNFRKFYKNYKKLLDDNYNLLHSRAYFRQFFECGDLSHGYGGVADGPFLLPALQGANCVV